MMMFAIVWRKFVGGGFAECAAQIMSWNIHRGYDLRAIEREIGRESPDILLLQVNGAW
jgi:hypothetical protein